MSVMVQNGRHASVFHPPQPHPAGVRLPSSSGHPICTDLVSVGEDVHCEFVKEKYTPQYRQEAARLVIESG